jgi:hypothetical protein
MQDRMMEGERIMGREDTLSEMMQRSGVDDREFAKYLRSLEVRIARIEAQLERDKWIVSTATVLVARGDTNETESSLGYLWWVAVVWGVASWGVAVYYMVMPPVAEKLHVSRSYALFFAIFLGVPAALIVVRLFVGWRRTHRS